MNEYLVTKPIDQIFDPLSKSYAEKAVQLAKQPGSWVELTIGSNIPKVPTITPKKA